jgi:polysaccharide biosynthesis transport protein
MITNANDNRSQRKASAIPQSLDVFSLVNRRWKQIAAGMVCGIALAVIYCLTATPLYESTAEILIVGKNASLATSAGGNANGQVIDPALGDEILATHLHILQSPTIIRTAIAAKQLDKLPSLLSEIPDDTEDISRSIASVIRRKLAVERGGEAQAKDARVLRVTYRNAEPEDAEAVLAAIVDAYQEFASQVIQGVGGEAIHLIQQARSDLESEVHDRDQEFAEFVRQSPLLSFSGETINPHMNRLNELQLERSRLDIAEANIRSRLSLVEETRAKAEGGSLQLSVIDPDDVSRLNLLVEVDRNLPSIAVAAEYSRLRELKSETARLANLVGPRHPRALEKTAQLEAMAEDLEGMTALSEIKNDDGVNAERIIHAYATLLRRDLEDVNRSKGTIAELIAHEEELARGVVETELRQNRHRRQLERAEALYDVVVERLGDLDLLSSFAGFSNVILSPVEPGDQVWPHIPLLLLAGAVLGTMLGGISAVASELSEKSFRSPTDIESELQVPVWSHFPVLANWSRDSRSDMVHSSLVAWTAPHSEAAEVIRDLRNTLLSRRRPGRAAIVQVTSPGKGEGKSTICCNLAISLAMTHRRVLLIDCDLRTPSVARLFGIEADEALVKRLHGKADFAGCHYATIVPGLTVAPCTHGAGTQGTEELLGCEEFSEYLNAVRGEFDFILLDSPGIQSGSDSVILGQHADNVLLVLGIGPLTRVRSQQAVARLAETGTGVAAVIVNEFGTSSTYLSGKRSSMSSMAANSRERAIPQHPKSRPIRVPR